MLQHSTKKVPVDMLQGCEREMSDMHLKNINLYLLNSFYNNEGIP